MPRVDCVRRVAIERTPRVMQLEGLFDVPRDDESVSRWSLDVPLEERDWQIGLIVGPSGCGKTTLARELFPARIIGGFEWPEHRSLVDAFPESMGIRDVTGLLSSVGFSSPPSWLRPFRVLSNGEQFRATIARALAESPDLAVIDEFTSVVDRTVARIGSCAVARAIRRRPGLKFVAVSCHYDIIDWLQPDWLLDPSAGDEAFQWRSLRRRPEIRLDISRSGRQAWNLFSRHHYLSTGLCRAARCFLAKVEGSPAAFTAVLSHPDRLGGYWREHRTVCLPDFQGAGIGHALSEFVASLFAATGKRYMSITGHPAMIAHRLRSPLWRMYRKPSFTVPNQGNHDTRSYNRTIAHNRRPAGFRYVGPANVELARAFGVLRPRGT